MTVIVEEGNKQILKIRCSCCGHIVEFEFEYNDKITLDMLVCEECGAIL